MNKNNRLKNNNYKPERYKTFCLLFTNGKITIIIYLRTYKPFY